MHAEVLKEAVEEMPEDVKKKFSEMMGGMDEHPVPYDEKKMLDAVGHPAVKGVRVFRMSEKQQRNRRKRKRQAQRKARRKGR